MKWESSGLDYRLVADDGEILDRVQHRGGEYEVQRCANWAECMRPFGGRAWSPEQVACFEALTAIADFIRKQT